MLAHHELPQMTGKTMTLETRSTLKFTLAPLALLMIPLLGMQLSDEVNWGPGDFLVMGVMLVSLGFAISVFRAFLRNRTIRLLANIGAVVVFLLIWIELAVGIFGEG